MNRNTARAWGASLTGLAMGLVLLQPSPAAAQASDQDDETVTADELGSGVQSDNEIVVTGTGTNISGVKPVGSEAVTVTREEILASGKTSPADVVRTLPQVRDLGSYREGGTQGSANSQQGNAINLRGLGAEATLVLVDGHRVVGTGAAAIFTEANQVPLAAIERIEVIADGASAIYGSDAVAGVVNYVLRKDFDGFEASFRASNNTGGWEYTPGLTAGTHWDMDGRAGNIIVAYEYTHRDPYLRGENKFLRQDLRPVGGPDLGINGANGAAAAPGNIVVATSGTNNPTIPLAGANVYYGVPVDSDGIGITFDQLRLNDPNLLDNSYYTDYTGKIERHHVSAYFNQELTDWLTVFAQGSYSNRHTYSRQVQGFIGSIINVEVPAFLTNPATGVCDPSLPNPAYIPGIPGVAPASCGFNPMNGQVESTALTVQYNFIDSAGLQNWDNAVEDYNITAGGRFDFGDSGWGGEAYFTHGFDDACNFCALDTNVSPEALQYLIDTGEINPFSPAPLSQATLDRFLGDNLQQSGNTFDNWVAKFDGPLFALPGGTVRAAVGGELTRLANWNVNGRNQTFDNQFVIDTDKELSIRKRTIKSVFGELYVPLIGPDMDVPGVQELIVDAAVRYDHYSDVGSTTNPKIGVTWDVTDRLSLRGSWGTSFRAPSLPDTNPYAASWAIILDPFPNNNPNISNDFCFGPTCLTTFAVILGGNPDVEPEEATNWSLGMDFEPVDNLRLGVTYYNIEYSNRIGGPSFGIIGLLANPAYPTYAGYDFMVVPLNNTNVTGPESCTVDPVLQEALDRPILYGSLTNYCNYNALVDARNINLAATKQDGIDAQISYVAPIRDGALTFDIAVNKILNNKEQVLPNTPFIDVLGRSDKPIEWRGRASVGANWRGLNAVLIGNYIGAYDNIAAVDPETNTVIGTQRVDPWTTFDLTLGYSGETGGFLKGYRASVTVQNLFDKDPPYVITSTGVFNASYSNPYGRTFTFQVSTSF